MILLKNFSKKIPSFRHKKELLIFDNSFLHTTKSKKTYNNNLNIRKKKVTMQKSVLLNTNALKHFSLITKNYYYLQKPYKKFIVCQTLNNFSVILPGIEFLTIGKILYCYKFFKDIKNKFYFKGFMSTLGVVPLVATFSNVFNRENNRVTYAKAGGTYCKIKKSKKSKKKLIKVVLPSKVEVMLSKTTKVYIGKNTNFKMQKLTEGKWGFSFHKTKKINVRGVAMNPVDHPNGGRAKSVQPERSPWSWVAKKGK